MFPITNLEFRTNKQKGKDLHLNYSSLEEAASSTDHGTINTPDNRTPSVVGVGRDVNNTPQSRLSVKNSFQHNLFISFPLF